MVGDESQCVVWVNLVPSITPTNIDNFPGISTIYTPQSLDKAITSPVVQIIANDSN
jgi:hypothetical protein